jgi:hypothetical protein
MRLSRSLSIQPEVSDTRFFLIYIIEYENNFIIFRSIASAERIRLHSEEIRVEEKEKRSIEEIEKE